MSVTKGKMIVLNNSVEARDGEYNDWYTNQHLDDVLRIPGILAGRRFTRMAQQQSPDQPYRYSAMYDIDPDMAAQIISELARRANTPEMPLSTAVADPRYLSFFEAITPRMSNAPDVAPRFTLMVMSNAAEGREDEYNDWYDNTHIADALRVPGFVAAQRFRLLPAQRSNVQPWKYLCLYECDAESPQPIMEEVGRRVGTPEMAMSSAFVEPIFTCFLQPITELRSGIA
jgi:hypothetical protein